MGCEVVLGAAASNSDRTGSNTRGNAEHRMQDYRFVRSADGVRIGCACGLWDYELLSRPLKLFSQVPPPATTRTMTAARTP